MSPDTTKNIAFEQLFLRHAIIAYMKDWQAYFKGKKVTVLGLGLLGRGVGDVAFLAECGADLIVTDTKSEAELKESLDKLEVFSNITYVLGEHRYEDFEGRDLVLVAAGVPFNSPYVAHAREKSTRLVQSAALFAELSEISIIGVTGTRGKSTVTHMIHHTLTELTGERIILGGNVRGVSNLQLFKEVREDSIAVMELDSWQLQGFGWAGISPQIAVFTNFMEDHMNYYKNDMGAYFADKANIFLNQRDGDTFITIPSVWASAQAFMRSKVKEFTQEVILVDESMLPEELLLRVPGAHNRQNAALAFCALRAVGLTEEEALQGLSTFNGVEGRLQYLTDIHGVRVYNDNNATTPFATKTGIEAVQNGKNVILLAGGAYKEVDPAILVPTIEAHCKKVVLLNGTGTDRLKDFVQCEVVFSLEEGVAAALKDAEAGDVFLFSPGFASFGMFRNEYDRNDQFVKIIASYETE